MLFDTQRHEPLTTSVWQRHIVQNEITLIIDDIEKSLLPNACWPTHPLDAESYPKRGLNGLHMQGLRVWFMLYKF